jgi:hypothetical protein
MTAFDEALKMILMLLRPTPSPTEEEIRRRIDTVLAVLTVDHAELAGERDRLIRHVENLCNIQIGHEMVLEDRKDHQSWLPNSKAAISWRFWNRYRDFLLEDLKWSTAIVNRLDDLTDRILGLVENPKRDGAWDNRGMVVGQVQSGKTANYAGLVCKAADAGYRVIVILTGMMNSLRSQTQYRLDESFLGFNTHRATAYNQNNQRLGVGLRRTEQDEPVAHSLTGSAEDGDFNKTVANQIGVIPGGNDPVIVVVKKNKRILDNLRQWLSLRAHDGVGGRQRISGIPLLVIDDEADNASVNTKPIPLDENGKPLDEYDVTAINGMIRQLLDTFQKSAYVGYTATPFANIFIDPSDETAAHGEGLFPRSFIVALPTPSNHIGPEQVFGLDRDPEAGILTEQDGLPVIRTVRDSEPWLPSGHKNGHPVHGLPESLRDAVRSFILTCAARRARGQKAEHNSMLVHVTRFTSVQQAVADATRTELHSLVNRLRYGDGNFTPPLRDQLRQQWENDFEATTRTIIARGVNDAEIIPLTWQDLEPYLVEAASAITVRLINGTVADLLDYRNNPEGVSVIAIGGDKLSRGLTLEGLSVSYFLRSSRMYDTLMQMGRWFGYRPGYLDLCRLYTTADLTTWYRHIALATAELKREFEHMAAIGGTPRDYGLRVRTHPNGLQITGASKLRTGTEMKVSFSGTIAETVVLFSNPDVLRQNAEAIEAFLLRAEALAKRKDDKSRSIWSAVPADEVIQFLQDYRTHPEALKVNSDSMARFIGKKMRDGGLTEWSVVLLKGGTAAMEYEIPPVGKVGLTRRERLLKDDSKQCLRRIVSRSDELLDLCEAERAEALRRTIEAWEKKDPKKRSENKPTEASGPFIRDVRPKERGLLLIYPVQFYERRTPDEDPDIPVPADRPVFGIALSFPSAGLSGDDGVVYRVNNIYWQQEFELQ